MAIKHAFTSAKSDGGDATLVKPSDWNADHVAFPLDTPPTSSSTWDDEFNGSSLDGKWTTGSSGITTTVANGYLLMVPSVASKHGYLIRQVAPTGNFTITTKLTTSVPGLLSDHRPGIFVARTASSLALVCGYNSSSSGASQAMWIEHSNYSESVDWGGYNGSYSGNVGWSSPLGLFYWYRLRYATPTLFMDFSVNGVNWYNFGSRSWSQPDRVGIAIENNTGNALTTEGVVVEFFRITEP